VKKQHTTPTPQLPVLAAKSVLDQILHEGAQAMLSQAIELEVATYVARHAELVNAKGHRLVVRNGYMPEREILTGAGPITVKQPRVNDLRLDEEGQRMRFSSSILPKYLRRSKTIDELIPWLYLKGISTGDFSEALSALVGINAAGLSANTITRLKDGWRQEHGAWSSRSLAEKRYVYFWVDGIHFNIRLEEDRQCILVIMGATEEGKKELVAVQDGYRESEQSWHEILLDLKNRGLMVAPQLAVGDGALGFWKALRKTFPNTRQQRCWVHKTGNILNKLPKGLQKRAKGMIQEIWMAPTQRDADQAFDLFVGTYSAKYDKAVECLSKDRDELLAFYSFPAEHWKHLRTTNPIESTFATVRLRTAKTKGCGTRLACLAMVFKLAQSAERRWRRLDGSKLLADVIRGVQFVDGIRKNAA